MSHFKSCYLWFALVMMLFMTVSGVSFPQRQVTSNDSQADAVMNMIHRLLSRDVASQFSVDIISSTTIDIFEIDNRSVDGGIILRGSTGVAAASAFNFYMKYITKSHFSWGKPHGDGWDGDNITLKSGMILPKLETKISHSFNVPVRYGWNVCTYGYTAGFWAWERWEREIDWLAMNGVNYPLASEGSEFIISKVFIDLGLSESDLDKYFSGPPFQPWNRMGNIQGWGGGSSASFRQRRFQLQQLIVKRMIEFGMIPILPAFGGIVPQAMITLTTNVTRSPLWAGQPDQYSGNYLLSPSDPFFSRIAIGVIKTIKQEIGDYVHVYNADTFNEMNPESSDDDYLALWGSAVYSGMKEDPNAIWLFQGWLFLNKFWTTSRVEAYLRDIPKDRLLILDLFADSLPQSERTNQFGNRPFIWSMLHNFGGTSGMWGNLDVIAENPIKALTRANSTMVGMGISPEAIEQNYIMYEFMLEMTWRAFPIDVDGWVTEYQQRRYGTSASPNTLQAWKILRNTIYRGGTSPSRINRRPTMERNRFNTDDTTSEHVRQVWLLMKESFLNTALPTNPFHHDMVDVSREMLAGLFEDIQLCYVAVYYMYEFQTINNFNIIKSTLASLHNLRVSILMTMDSILATNSNFLLGTWIQDAKLLAVTGQEAAQFEFNARRILTLWGANDSLNDYATKQWAGFIGDYHRGRYEIQHKFVEESLDSGKYFPVTDFHKSVLEFEQAFSNDTTVYPFIPQGDLSSLLVNMTVNFRISDDYIKTANYIMNPNLDYYDYDIVRVWTRDINQLAYLCDSLVMCKGFNSSGYLKYDTKNSQARKVQDVTFYTKQL